MMSRTKIEGSLRKLCGLLLLTLAVLVVGSCSSIATPQAGSETHFLMSCESSCGAGLQCICGVCSRLCVQEGDCARLSDAASCTPLSPRVAQGRCDDTPIGAMCDADCLTDADCSAIASARRCNNGYCRDVETTVEPAPASCMPSNIAPTDVLILGDVLLELSIFAAQLEQAAVAAGSLASGQHYRNDAAGGSSRLATGALSLDGQYSGALRAGAARVIIMDGGATDVLNDDCAGMLTPECPAARDAVNGAEQLFARFAEDGVEQLVYFFYGDPIDNPPLKAGLDLLRPLLQNACGRSPVPCHWLDLRAAFDGHPEYLGVDGLVFTDAGATAAAAATFELMQARCVAN
jgi:hypothetical protein